jgi:hypothetical protein
MLYVILNEIFCVVLYQLSLGELKSQLQTEMQTLQKLQGKSGTDEERRRHVTELGRHQAWLEHEPEVARVIEDILQTGNKNNIWVRYFYTR